MKNLESGRYYHIITDDGKFERIIKSAGGYNTSYSIYLDGPTFENHTLLISNAYNYLVSECTPDQMHHLELCKTEGRYVEYNYTIPEKWCIRRMKDNAKVLNKYFAGITGRRYTDESNSYDRNFSYMHYPSTTKTVYPYIGAGYKLISFDQFQKYIMSKLTINQLIPGKIYHAISSKSGFTQLFRFKGGHDIDKNVDVGNPDKPILRSDNRIADHSKWEIRDATASEIVLYKQVMGEEVIVHSYNLI